MTVLGYGSHTAGYIIQAGAQAANLVGLSLPVEGAQLRPNGNKTPGLFDLGANAQLFQRGGMALEHMGSGRDKLEEQPAGLFTVLSDQGVKAIGFESPSRPLDLVL